MKKLLGVLFLCANYLLPVNAQDFINSNEEQKNALKNNSKQYCF